MHGRNDGKEAENAFLFIWQKTGHIERFRDKRDLVGLNKGARLADFGKPADFIVSSPNCALHYAEVKSIKDGNRFPFSNIKPSQHKAAILEATKGQGAYVLYIFSYTLGKWFAMNCKDYAERVANGDRSVKLEELRVWP